ncbi:MAG: Crp/Fnr family transcriptional regulator [Ruminococcaceae bacterium]|nr:Crp/Fnr family transcriptional regulator [Oscillospiraceae bacterium]
MKYQNLFLLKGLELCDIDQIVKLFPPSNNFKKGETIYSDKVFNNAIGFIIKGKAFAVSNNQNKIMLQTFEQGMCFGAAALFGGKDTYVSTITAKSDCEILFLNEQTLKQIFEKYPKTALNYITFLSDKVRLLNNKLCVISCSAAEDTLYTYFSSVADSEGFAQIPQNMTRFAKTLGLSRATLYRALDILLQNGSILKENNKFKVIKNEKTN